MKNYSFIFILLVSFCISQELLAQRVAVDITIDPKYGSGGKIEADPGGLGAEVMAFDGGKDISSGLIKKTTVCGKLKKANPNTYEIGMLRVDTSGKADASFGSGGMATFSWSETDYPNDMIRHKTLDSDYVIAGSGGSASIADQKPALYRIKKNGTPDSSFGVSGRLLMPFDEDGVGEATNIYLSNDPTPDYFVLGVHRTRPEGVSGFGFMAVKQDGTLDSSKALNGRAIIPALVHSVHGFYPINGGTTLLCGISDTGKHELLLGYFDFNGKPDSTYGINGLLHTGIFIPGDTIMCAMESNIKIVILMPTPDSSPTPLTICRILGTGSIDSTYGKDGFGKNYIMPSITPRGLYIANDNSETISGMADSGLGESMFVRLAAAAAYPDSVFNRTGITVVDVDAKANPNYLKWVLPIGKLDQTGKIKRFICIGGSIHNGIEEFMITRFISTQQEGVIENSAGVQNLLRAYPNPASSHITFASTSGSIRNIRIIGVDGSDIASIREGIYSPDINSYTIDVSGLANGSYYCIGQVGSEDVVRKFIVQH